MGPIRERELGGIAYIGESRVCIAKQSVKFDCLPFRNCEGTRLNIKFRRFFYDGIASAKYEIGFKICLTKKNKFTLKDLLGKIVNTTVRVNIPRENKQSNDLLVLISPYLAKRYIFSTSSLKVINNNFTEIERNIKWDTPIIFVESDKDEIKNDLNNYIINLNSDNSISFSYTSYNNKKINIWHLEKGNSFDSKLLARNVRAIILSSYALRSTLCIILDSVYKEEIYPDLKSNESDILQRYLLNTIKKISYTELNCREEKTDNPFLSLVKQIEDNLTIGIRSDVMYKLKNTINIRPQIFKLIEKYFYDMEKEGKKNETNINVKLDNVNNSGEIVIGGNIKKATIGSFKQNIDIAKYLCQISEELEKIKDKIPENEYIRLKSDLNSAENEPDVKKKRVIIEKFKNSLISIKEIAVPILEVVGKVLPLFAS